MGWDDKQPLFRLTTAVVKALTIVLTVALLRSDLTWHTPIISALYAKYPTPRLHHQALALNIPRAKLAEYRQHPDWPLSSKIEFLLQPSLKQIPRAKLHLAEAYYEAGKLATALLWTGDSSLENDLQSTLLRSQILLEQSRFSEALATLKAKRLLQNPQALAIVSKIYLASNQFDKAYTLLSNSNEFEIRALKNKLDQLLQHRITKSKCSLTIQFVVAGFKQLEYAVGTMEQWSADKMLATLPICFNPAKLFEPKQFYCQAEAGQRQNCDLTLTAEKLDLLERSLPVFVQGQSGIANYNNGVIFINHLKSFGVFKHELLHHFGFLDEYQLPDSMVDNVCDVKHEGFVGENLYMTRKHFQQPPLGLIPVDTCAGNEVFAYKLVKQLTIMEYMDQSIPASYLKKIERQLNDPAHQLSNYQYAYALAFKNKGDQQKYYYWLKTSAQLGYVGAQKLLADFSSP